MKRFLLAGSLLCCFAASVLGQTTPTDFTPVDFSFRLGAAMPLDDDLIDSTPVTYTLGVDYRMSYSFIRFGETFLSWDWVASNDGIHVIALNQKFFTGPSAILSGEGYAFIGLGGAWYGGVDFERASLAIRGGIGVEMSPTMLVELGGSGSRDQDEVNPSFIYLSVGIKY
jgi:hypothetical protein